MYKSCCRLKNSEWSLVVEKEAVVRREVQVCATRAKVERFMIERGVCGSWATDHCLRNTVA